MKPLILIAFAAAIVIFWLVRAVLPGIRAAHRQVFGTGNQTSSSAGETFIAQAKDAVYKLYRASTKLGVEVPDGDDKVLQTVAGLSAEITKSAAARAGTSIDKLNLEEASFLNVITIIASDALSRKTFCEFELSGSIATASLWMGRFEPEEAAAILDNSTRSFNDLSRDAKWAPIVRKIGTAIVHFFDTGEAMHLEELVVPAKAFLAVARE